LSSLSALRHTIGGVAGVVILRSIDRSERVAVASALRGLGASLGDERPEAFGASRGELAESVAQDERSTARDQLGGEYQPRAKLS
jgi:hypothetical protein